MPEYRNPITTSRRRAHMLVLEPRMMFDAAAVVVAGDAIAESSQRPSPPPDDTAPVTSRFGLIRSQPEPMATAAIVPTAAPSTDAAPVTADRAGPSRAQPEPLPEIVAITNPAEPGQRAQVEPREAVQEPTESGPAAPRDIIFIDTSVADYRQLAAEWAGRGEVVLIDGTRDGIAQMRAALAGQRDVGAIHIVSHGAAGAFWIGTTQVDEASITGALAGALGEIGAALRSDGDILIYGCDFAEGAGGARALTALAAATQADVAASTDTTGYAGRGGDWSLEASRGTIEAGVLGSTDWAHTLDPNTPVPIAVTADSLTVRNGAGTVVTTGSIGYGTDARSPDVGVGATATWAGAATFNGRSVDLRATVVSISSGDAVRFNRPTATGANGDDPTFLLRDLTGANDATVEIRWELIDSLTGNALPADVRFTIADIDGIGGNPNTRETVTASTQNLAYFTRERVSNINFSANLNSVTASGTQDENTTAGAPITPQSAATFDWSEVSAFTLTYRLTTNGTATQAQFFHDGDADFVYSDPVYLSIPRLDLDGNDSSAAGNDALATFTENGSRVGIVDADLVVANPMPSESITGATVRLTNWRDGDNFAISPLPAGITATIGAVTGGTQTITLSGVGSETDYADALRAITFANSSDTPDTTQRVLEITFSNDTLTSATAISRINVVPVNDAPVNSLPGAQSVVEDGTLTFSAANGNALSIANADGGDQVVTITVTQGVFTLGSLTGLTFSAGDGTSDATMTFTGSVAAINAALEGARFVPAADANGTAELTINTATVPVEGEDFQNGDAEAPVRPNASSTQLLEGQVPGWETTATDNRIEIWTNGHAGVNAFSGRQFFEINATQAASLYQEFRSVAGSAVTLDFAHRGRAGTDTMRLTATDLGGDGVFGTADDVVIAQQDYTDGNTAWGQYTRQLTAAATGNLVRVDFRSVATATGDQSVGNFLDAVVMTQAGRVTSDSDTLAIGVTPVADAANDSATTPENTPVTIDVLANDSFEDPARAITAIDGSAIAAGGAAVAVANGEVTLGSDGRLTFTPAASYIGATSFTYTVTSGGVTETATVDVTVTNAAPTANPDSASTAEDRAVTIAVLGNDTDPEGDALSVTAASALNGTVLRNADGTLTYTPNADYNGADTISYTISDGNGGTSSSTVTVQVAPQPDTPVNAVPGAQAMAEDGTLVFSAANGNALTVTDVDGGLQTVTITVTRGTFSLAYSTGLTFAVGDGITDTTMTFTGTTARINEALEGARFTPDADAHGTAELTINTATVPVEGEDFQNGGAEAPVIPDASILTRNEADVPGWETTATDGQIEIWSDGNAGVPAHSGRQFFEINANQAASLYQEVRSVAGSAVNLDFAHRGRAGADTMRLIATDLGGDGVFGTADDVVIAQQDYTDGNTAWGVYNRQLTAAASGNLIRIEFRSISTATGDPSVGNFLDSVVLTQAGPATSDSDTLAITITPVADVADDSATTPEDIAVTLDVLANDSFEDPSRAITAINGAAITAGGAAVAVANGQVTLGSDGQLTFTPAAGYNGATSFTYTVSSGGTTETATATITVTPGNDVPAPVGTLPSRSALDGAAISFATAGGFSDPDGDTLSYSATGLPAGLTINVATGVISGTIDRSASQSGGGSYTVVVTARDPSNASTTQSFVYTVTNPGPSAVNDSASTSEDTPVTIAVLANDSDPDGDTLSVIAASALHGTVVRNADGTISYTPDPDYVGSDTISYTISDGQGGVASATVAVTVGAANDAPETVGSLPARSTSDAATVSYSTAGAFTDRDGDTLSYSAAGLPAGLTINAATGVISGTVDRSASQVGGGSYTVVVTARDPANATATQSFTITVTNPGPSAVNDSAATTEDTPVTITVLGNDSDPDGDPLTVTAASALNGTVVRNPDGTLTYTPNADYNGSDTITYTISDGQGGTATATVAITITAVNDAPTAVGTLPARNGADATTVAFATADGFGDVDGDALTYSASGLPAGLTINAATGVVSGTIDRSASQTNGGSYTIVVTARDPSNAIATQSFVFTVTNPGPVAANDSATTNEDTPVTIAVLANDGDPDGDPLTVTAASALNGTVVRNPDGTLTYTPNADYNGSDTISYTISDGQGGTATASVAVTIVAIDDAPRATVPPPSYTVADNTPVSFSITNAFIDPDGDPLTYSATGLPAGLTLDPATGIVSGTIDRSASQVNGGVYTIVLTARDPDGETATQSVTLTATNPAPTAVNDSATTVEDTPVTIDVLGNDSDPDGDPLTVTAASALNGIVSINPDGTLRYTPNANYNGTDTISYTISDGQGGTASAQVTVTITPVDDAPVAVGTLPGLSTQDGAIVSYATAGGFNDVDGGALSYSASGLPVGLSINAATGVISGTVDRSASQSNGGSYSVTVTARDSGGNTAAQVFAIGVTNPGPAAVNDAIATHAGTPVIIAVLANDSDPDSDPLTVISAGGASHGTVSINVDGTIRYTPTTGYVGSDTLTYTISDGQGGTATATVTIDITNDAPVASPAPPVAANDGQPVTLPLGPRFSDPDGDALSFSATGLPPGLTIDPVTGNVTGTIDRSASATNGGRYTSIITASDGNGGSVSLTLEWTVSNPPPVAQNDAVTTSEDQPIIIAVLGNDSDPDGDPLTVVSATAASGSVIVNPDGTLSYMAAPDFTGTDTITYTIDDGNGGRSTATVTVTVTPVNDAPVSAGLPSRSTAGGESVAVPVGPAFSDVDGDTLTYSAIGLPPGLTIDPVTGIISGTIAPGAVYGGPGGNGIYPVTVTARDGSGASVSAPFEWRVTQATPVARDDAATTAEDTPVTIPVLANDSDGDGDALSLVAASATNGAVYIVGGELVFYPAPDFTGTAIITYTVTDPAGNRSTASVTVTVTPVNDAPVASPIPAASARDGEGILLDVGGSFRDPEGDALTFSATGLPPGLSIDPVTGRIAGTIDRSASQTGGGVYRVTVTAVDPSGARSSSNFDWTITNPAPVARNDAVTTPEDTSVVIPVLANDNDPDGDPLTIVAASAANGMVTIGADGRLTYTPDLNFTGTDTIIYTIDDGNGGRAEARVSVTVTPVNDAPTAIGPRPTDVATTDSAVRTIETAPWFADIDGDPLSYVATGLPPGLAIDPATGRISGTIDRSASQGAGGIYAVTVIARDPSGAEAAVTFDIRVTNPGPTAVNDAASTLQEGAGIVIPVLGNDSDPDGDPLTVISATADHGTVTINPDGTVTYVPIGSFAGSDTIRYTISDGEGGTATATVAVTVAPVEHPPVAGPVGPIDAIGGRPVGIDVLPAASDPDGDPLSVIGATSAVGTVRVNPDGTLSFTPPLGFVGTTTITYTVSDGRGGTASNTVTVRVADGRGADIAQLLRTGPPIFSGAFLNPAPSLATDGVFRNPLSVTSAVNDIRSLRGTTIGDQPVGDAVEAIRSLRGTSIDPDTPILNEVDRLDALRDQRDAGDKLFDQRWGDFLVEGLTGFSAAADQNACIMIDSVVRGGAIYLEVRDTAEEGERAPIRHVDIRMAGGGRVPEWIKVDGRGYAIIERGADMDELRLVVRVTRTDGSVTSTPILVQGETGEVELDRVSTVRGVAPPPDLTLQPPSAAIQSEATRLASFFQ